MAVVAALVLASAAWAVDGGATGNAPAPFALGLLDKPWRLLVSLPGFEMDSVQQRPGGARALGTSATSGLFVSLTLAASPGDPSARSCRDHDWAGRQQEPLAREETHLSSQGDQARVEFLVPSNGGEVVQEKHVLLYLQRDGVCAIVHLFKRHYRAEDAETLERILGSVRLGS